jgi:cell division protein ZapA
LGAEAKPSVRVQILDTEYSVTGYSDAEYMHQVAGIVDRHMRLLEEIHQGISPQKNAILTALNLADELIRLRQQLEQYQKEASDYSREIADRTRKLAELCSQRRN